MKTYILSLLTLFLFVGCSKEPNVYTMTTTMGDIKIKIFDTTPGHRDNFKKLVESGFYNDLLFHRVIEDFMIQGGDPESKSAQPGAPLGKGGPGYTIPAEIGIPHFRGMIAAARQGDQVNPEKASSGSQFYIVHGRAVTDEDLDMFEKAKGLKYSEAQRKKYKSIGGVPMLDGDYTVFGEVISGMEVIDKIVKVPKDDMDRPIKDIKMKIK